MRELKRPQECVNVNCIGICSMADYEFNKRLFGNNPTKCPGYKKGSEKKLIIEELEKIKQEIQSIIALADSRGEDTKLAYQCQIAINERVSELKGEQEWH